MRCRCATRSSTSAANSTFPIVGWPRRSRRPTPPATSASASSASEFACDIVVYRGAGSYVCGEASGLLSSLEGKRGYPRNRPPRLTVQGLYKRPTVVNNVETLANIAGIVANGAAWYKTFGTAKSPGTQLVSISGHIARPGVYEVEYGYPLAKFLYEDCGGMTGGRKLKALIPGGISTKVLTGDEVENVTFDHQSLTAAGSSVGSGGMVAIAEGTCMVRLLQVMLRFYHHESCGQCTPCREGMGWLHRIIDRIVAGEGRTRGHRSSLSDLAPGTTATRSAAWAMRPAMRRAAS